MIATDLLALLPIITLTCVILVVMMVIAFARNLALTCLCSCLGLALTLAAIAWVSVNLEPQYVTPLIVVDEYALLFSSIIVIGAFFICLLAYSYHADRGEKQDEYLMLLLLSTPGRYHTRAQRSLCVLHSRPGTGRSFALCHDFLPGPRLFQP